MAPRDVAIAALRSADELRLHLYKPVRIRMHPDDVRDLRAELLPDVKRSFPIDGSRLWGYPIVSDEATRRGEPVAEWDAPGDAA